MGWKDGHSKNTDEVAVVATENALYSTRVLFPWRCKPDIQWEETILGCHTPSESFSLRAGQRQARTHARTGGSAMGRETDVQAKRPMGKQTDIKSLISVTPFFF